MCTRAKDIKWCYVLFYELEPAIKRMKCMISFPLQYIDACREGKQHGSKYQHINFIFRKIFQGWFWRWVRGENSIKKDFRWHFPFFSFRHHLFWRGNGQHIKNITKQTKKSIVKWHKINVREMSPLLIWQWWHEEILMTTMSQGVFS